MQSLHGSPEPQESACGASAYLHNPPELARFPDRRLKGVRTELADRR